jgi:hypothetical protein
MQAPAALSRDGCDGGAWRTAVALLHGLAAAAVLAWALAPMWAVLGLLVAGLVWRVAATPSPRLVWDGRAWQLDGAEAQPAIALDLGGWILIRVHAAGRRHWLPLSPAADPAGWVALRAALHAPMAAESRVA